MQHSAIKSTGELVTLYSKTEIISNECLIWQLNADGSFSSVSYTPTITEVTPSLFSTDYTLPDVPCTIVVLFKKQPIVISVGDTDRMFVYYRVEEGQDVPYSIITSNGSEADNGLLNELSGGFYFKNIMPYDETTIFVDGKPYPIRLPYPGPSIEQPIYGSIKIQNNVWQLVSIPREGSKVKEYFVDALALKYSAQASDMIEICTAYFGDENKFRSYVPGVTNPLTANNFPLIYTDGASKEITGFWIKTKDMTGIVPDVTNIVFDWSTV